MEELILVYSGIMAIGTIRLAHGTIIFSDELHGQILGLKIKGVGVHNMNFVLFIL